MEPEHVKVWKEEIEAWELDGSKPNPFTVTTKGVFNPPLLRFKFTRCINSALGLCSPQDP